MKSELFSPSTAVGSLEFSLDDERANVAAYGLAGSERIAIQLKVGSNWLSVPLEDGSSSDITATNTIRQVQGPGAFRLSKGVISGAVSMVFYIQE